MLAQDLSVAQRRKSSRSTDVAKPRRCDHHPPCRGSVRLQGPPLIVVSPLIWPSFTVPVRSGDF